MYIFIYMYYISYIIKCVYICNHENNLPSRLPPQWLCGNSYTTAHDIQLHIVGTNEPKILICPLMYVAEPKFTKETKTRNQNIRNQRS